MKENKEYYGIYLNGKIPKTIDKEKDKYNKYNRSVKLEFEGKAYLIDDKGNNKEELKNNSKLKKEGKHTIKLINTKNDIYYINIKIRKLGLICLFFIAFLIILGSIFIFNKDYIKQYSISEFSSFEIDLKGIKYVFDIGYEDTNFKSVELTDKVSEKNIIYPGSSGTFYVLISTKNGNKDMIYTMQIQEEINKPKNLKFETNGKIYNSMKELSNDINGTIKKDSGKVLKIDWFWDYDTNDDMTDTENAISIENNYKFLMRMIGNEKI